MLTAVTRLIGQLMSRPSAAKGMLWSLGLHATAFAATYTWWPSPIDHVSFAGDRFVVQIEASFSELGPAEAINEEIEAVIECDPVLLVEESPQEPLSRIKPEFDVDAPSLQLPLSPLQDNDVNKIIEAKPPEIVVASKVPIEIEIVEPPNKPPLEPVHTPTPEAVAVLEQFAGIEDLEPPDLSGNRAPSYPAEAIRNRWEGTVLLRLTIATSGKVEHVEIARSSGHSILDRTAVEAVCTWQARPAKANGQPVETTELLPVRFRL